MSKSKHYLVRTRTLRITESTVITDTDFGGWLARVYFSNSILGGGGSTTDGTTNAVSINGIPMQAGIDVLDFTSLQPNVLWEEPIRIEITGDATVYLTQLLYYKNVE